MGGSDGLTGFGLISRNLCNDGHIDIDESISISVFNEDRIGAATVWNFVFPNVTRCDGNRSKAIVIPFFHGMCFCQDTSRSLY